MPTATATVELATRLARDVRQGDLIAVPYDGQALAFVQVDHVMGPWEIGARGVQAVQFQCHLANDRQKFVMVWRPLTEPVAVVTVAEKAA